MKSIGMTSESYVGVPADINAFTLEDEKAWFDTKDISCLPAILATLKGLRAVQPVTAIAIKDVLGDDVSTATLSAAAHDEIVVQVVRTPVSSTFPITWASSDSTKASVTKLDDSSAVIKAVAADVSAVTITATGSTGITDTVSVTVSA